MSTTFETPQQASQRWITEGKTFKDELNNWLDIIYIDEKQPETDCPEDTRSDMAEYVREQIIAFNEEGKHEQLRELFPPDNDPMTWDGITICASQVTILPDNRLVVTLGQWHQQRVVYVINDKTFEEQGDIFMFGKSADKKYFAKVYADKIIVTAGWDGPVVSTFSAPTSYGEKYAATFKDGLGKLSLHEFGIHEIVVFPSGRRIGLATAKGIFVVDETAAQFIETETVEAEEDDFTFRHDYPHIDVSPDEKYIVAGSQSSSHLIFEETAGIWTSITRVEPRSSYPNLARFNYKIKDNGEEFDGPQVLLSSCHFGGSASLSLPVKNIAPDFFASGYDADDTLNYTDTRKWVFSAVNYSWGFCLGCNDGYLWFKGYTGEQFGYLHVGGTVMDIDLSEDRKTMVVASYSGQVIVYKCGDSLFKGNKLFRYNENRDERRPDDLAITNTAFKDVRRYLFWAGENPMIW